MSPEESIYSLGRKDETPTAFETLRLLRWVKPVFPFGLSEIQVHCTGLLYRIPYCSHVSRAIDTARVQHGFSYSI